MRELYTDLEEKVEDKVLFRGKWVTMTSEDIDKLIGAPDHEEDDYSVLMHEGEDTTELVKRLCRADKVI